ncbi:MAG: VWD domain-containing protein [Nitrosomonas sp.]|nr:VWD domain-containing protein [Nitrosomonas sp.]MCB1975516.1 VWD domain-containing protein [Nitrosomonas sp.]
MPSLMIAANYIFGSSILTGDLDRSGHLQIVYDDDDPSTPLEEAEVQAPATFTFGNWVFQPFGQAHGANTPYIATDDTIENADRYAITFVGLKPYQTAENVWNMLESVHNALQVAAPSLEYDTHQNSNSYVRSALYTVGIDLDSYLAAATPADVRNFPGAETNILLGSRQNGVINVPIDLNLSGANSGTAGSDFIRTGIGNDTIEGSGGNDEITAGRGNDMLMGGAGFDTYNIAQSGDGVDTITDADGQGQIVITTGTNLPLTIPLFSIAGNAIPISGGVGGNQLYSIANNNIKLEYNSTTKVLNVIDWTGKGSSDNITINDFDSGELGITLPQGINLISGLGGSAGFGEQLLARNDDGSTGFIDITSIFEDNINFFGREFSGLWVNNNGSVTFNGARATFTPNVITGVSNNPEITPYFADVDTRGGAVAPTSGGNSTGSNLVYYDFDTVNDRFIVTWDDVGYFGNHTDKLNAFQLILTDRGNGDFDIEFRYEDVNWTTGDASGGFGGLGGAVARAGYTAGTGDPAAFFELPASGNQADMLALDETAGNTGDIGRWLFNVRSGDVVTSNIPPLPPIGVNGWTVGDPHISTLDGVGYDFQAAGEFVMLRGVSDPSFEIQARMVPIGNNVSVNSAVATNLGGVAVMVDAQDAIPLQIDGIATTINNFSSINVGNDRIFREDNTYTIVYAGADGVVNAGDSRLIVDVFSNRVDIDVRLNTDMAGDLEGLFGNGDGNPANDIALADGTVLDRPLAFDVLYGQYRDDWRVSDIADSLFTYDGGESLEGFNLPAYPSALITLDDLDPAVRSAAEQAVLNAGISRGTANFNNAVLDFALTGDSSYIASSLGVSGISESNYISVTPPAPNPPLSIHVIDNDVIDEGQVFTRTIAFTDGEDANADGWTYSVDWNDGNPVEAGSIAAGASSFNISRAFADGDASRTVSVTVTDVTGDSDTRQFVLDVNNVAPTIALAGAAEVNTGDSYALNLGAITDPGDDTVTSYIVNWGDGSVDVFNAAGTVAHVYAATGSNTIRVDLIDEDGTHVNAGNFAVSVNSPPPVEVVRIGDAPLRVSRSDPNAWENAWTDAKIDISHKADYLDPLENWSSAALNGNNSSVLNGGDIFGGDLGVSGQSLVSSTIRQEIDGTEALRFGLGETATKVTIDLSRLDGNSTTGHFDAGRLQLLDDAGTVVNELIFSANALSSNQQITLEHASGFSSAVLTAGVYNGADFIFGGVSDVNGQYLSGPQNQGDGTWNASEYLVDAVEFEFGDITLVGIAA